MTLAAFFGTIAAFNLVTFGNGLVMIPLLQAHLVESRHLLSLDRLLYAITVGRITPGQANLYVASIGYLLYGWPGAVLAVVAIAAPGFLVLPLVRVYEHVRGNRAVQGFAAGLTAVSAGLVIASTVQIARGSLHGATAWVTFPLTVVLILALRLNQFVGMLVAAGVGAAIQMIR